MEAIRELNSRLLLSFSLHLFILCCMNTSGSATPGNDTDKLALLAFKDGITQDPLGSLSSWNGSLHFCEWGGITCSRRHERVTILDLQSSGLVGSLPPHIGNLSFLKQISLQNNTLNGYIPQEMGRLFRLQHLNLSNNAFQGKIPANLTHCSDLRLLNLNYNELVGAIPLELGSLTKLIGLGFASNNLTGNFPPWIANLTSLRIFSLLDNNLEGSIPHDVGRITTLRFFQVSLNKLSGAVPPGLYNQSSLFLFSVAGNQLNGSLPPDIGLTLPNLQGFHAAANMFTGTIPTSFTNASGLTVLELSENEFSGTVPVDLGKLGGLYHLRLGFNELGTGEAEDLRFFSSLSNCSALESLDIRYNNFRGALPSSIANFSTRLRIMTFGGNEISGTIPSGIENLISLSLFSIAPNFIKGNIPMSIGRLPMLQELYLSRNIFSGQIPFSLGNITRLSRLHLQENSLSGEIPSSLGNCQSLLVLDLSQNNLSGNIPKQIFTLTSLSISLNLAQNSLAGSLPIQVGNLINLGELDVSHNRLTGEIPNSLGDCLKLESLRMEGNFFQGTIPQSLSTLKGIQVLKLSRNNLSGKIPGYLEQFTFLQNLNLSFNNLEGEVPNKGVFRNASAVSVRGNNKLCGGIVELRLQTCHITASQKQGMSHSLRVTIIVISLVMLLTILAIIVVVLHRIRKPRKKHSPSSSLVDTYQKVSYAELLQATGGFSSDNLIGFGSHGSVYKGILDPGQKVVAIKVLNLQQRGASKSFLAECDALRNIRHRNLIKILTACSSIDFKGNDFKALVFEYMPNGSLDSWLHPNVDVQHLSRHLNLLQRLNIAIDVASALDYLHHYCETPVVHCDLKPSNILLDKDISAQVGDFGLARFLLETSCSTSQNQTSTTGLKGTVGYVAPEYGMGGRVTVQGDVYSYGIVLLEMFTGKRPTDDMFKDGLTLYNIAKMALPERVAEIVDPTLQLLQPERDDNHGDDEEAINNVNSGREKRDEMEKCLVSVVRIGVLCSAESPGDRMGMEDVANELRTVRDTFLGVGIYANRRNHRDPN